MKIAYITNVRLPSERAHGHQIAQVCDALVHLGHTVELIAPHRLNPITKTYKDYYGADENVGLTHLGKFDPINKWYLPGVISLWTLNHLLRKNMGRYLPTKEFDLFYTRSQALLPELVKHNVPIILELHQLPRLHKKQFVRLCNKCAGVACLTNHMSETLIQWGVEPKKVMTEGDAVDLTRFENMPSQSDARKKWNINTDRKIVGYIGRLKTLGMEKGVQYILESLAQLKDKQSHFGLIVGGPDGDQKEYEAMADMLGLTEEDVLFTGSVPATDVIPALVACDILAMPFPDFPHYRHHMSPLKMFEYMAANKPLVTSDLPTVRDVLSEKNAIFCEPGSTDSFTAALQWIQENAKETENRARNAYELVTKEYSWETRMERIFDRFL